MTFGRPLCSHEEAELRGYRGPEAKRRREVLRETIDAFQAQPPDHFHRRASANLDRWNRSAARSSEALVLQVLRGDWGDVTLRLTQEFGACFAVLNMANAFVPGGGYVEGAVAQEENMFRRTDCHFRVGPEEYDVESDRYRPEMTALVSGVDGRVYLDHQRPRVCIRGSENRSRPDLGYPWLAEDEVFPFYELRAAARDLRGGAVFDLDDARRRIAAQLDTLVSAGLRHVVLGASGCGAFGNPAPEVAHLYKGEIAARQSAFSVVAFAIFAPGYGPSNYEPFAEILGSSQAARIAHNHLLQVPPLAIHVCPISKLEEVVAATHPEKVVSILDPHFETPALGLGPDHLRLAFHDIHVPTPGAILPSEQHVAELVDFLRSWTRARPLLVHCRAGVGRSTAAAYVASCIHNPSASELELARALIDAAPLARPNQVLVGLADVVLGRGGRMGAAIEEVRRDLPELRIPEGVPFALTIPERA